MTSRKIKIHNKGRFSIIIECHRKLKCVVVYGKLFQHCGDANVNKKITVQKCIEGIFLCITSCFPSKIFILSKQCAHLSLIVLITFISRVGNHMISSATWNK